MLSKSEQQGRNEHKIDYDEMNPFLLDCFNLKPIYKGSPMIKCAYCGSKKELTIDHVVPRCKGGSDFTKNVVCCCHSCNQSKAHSPWEEWYLSQDFFSLKNYNKIINWMKPDPPQNLFAYRPRRNNAT